MKPTMLVVGSLSAALSSGAFAGSMGKSADSGLWSRVMTISSGLSLEASGKTQTFYLSPDIENKYSATKRARALVSGELFLGCQRGLSSILTGQLGLAGVISSGARPSGDIWEDANPKFNNFYYTYRVHHKHIALKGKLLADVGWIVRPYGSLSAGVGVNRAHEYSLTSKLPAVIPSEGFGSDNTTAFTYTAGVGVQKAITPQSQVGLGYDFADWGKSSLARAPSQTLGHGLRLNHLYTHQLQLSLNIVG